MFSALRLKKKNTCLVRRGLLPITSSLMEIKFSWFGYLDETKTRQSHRLVYHTSYAGLQLRGAHVSAKLVVVTEDLPKSLGTQKFSLSSLSNTSYDPLTRTLTWAQEEDVVNISLSETSHKTLCNLLEKIIQNQGFGDTEWDHVANPKDHGLRDGHDYLV